MKELEVYLHIPFCVKKCGYCDFPSHAAPEEERETYVQKLVGQIRSQKDKYTEYTVVSVFVGGGTPSILSEGQLQRIFEAVRETFRFPGEQEIPTRCEIWKQGKDSYVADDARVSEQGRCSSKREMDIAESGVARDDCLLKSEGIGWDNRKENVEITVEVNPGTVTREKLLCLKACGVNRLSIGLQSVNDEELRMLGRIHTYEEFLQTYQMARDIGFDNINVDLISAIPGQTVESYEETLRTVARLEPEHISAYSLILEEGTPFYDIYTVSPGKELLPSEEDERRMYELTEEVLETYGFRRYEISNYAKEGRECIHNLGYWKRREYLGLGSYAASFVDHKRFTWGDLMETAYPLIEEVHTLTKQEEMEEFMYLGLRVMEGVSKRAFEAEFGVSMDAVYGGVLDRLQREGLIFEKNEFVSLTKRGVDVSNRVLAEFLI